MNKKTLFIMLGAIIIVGGVVWALSDQNSSSTSNEIMMMEEKEMMIDDNQDALIEEGVMEGKKMMEGEEKIMKQEGAYKDYSATTVNSEQAAGQKVVLFFHAPWCPFCRTADSAFQAQLDKIPDGVTVLKTDYDSQTELKQKYGVTYQHTFVQIDNQGNQIIKWSGGDVDTLIANLR